jgi:hypothetical protein
MDFRRSRRALSSGHRGGQPRDSGWAKSAGAEMARMLLIVAALLFIGGDSGAQAQGPQRGRTCTMEVCLARCQASGHPAQRCRRFCHRRCDLGIRTCSVQKCQARCAANGYPPERCQRKCSRRCGGGHGGRSGGRRGGAGKRRCTFDSCFERCVAQGGRGSKNLAGSCSRVCTKRCR